MRLYTLEINGKEQVAAAGSDAKKAWILSSLGYDFTDMNDLICRMTDAEKES